MNGIYSNKCSDAQSISIFNLWKLIVEDFAFFGLSKVIEYLRLYCVLYNLEKIIFAKLEVPHLRIVNSLSLDDVILLFKWH